MFLVSLFLVMPWTHAGISQCSLYPNSVIFATHNAYTYMLLRFDEGFQKTFHLLFRVIEHIPRTVQRGIIRDCGGGGGVERQYEGLGRIDNVSYESG